MANQIRTHSTDETRKFNDLPNPPRPLSLRPPYSTENSSDDVIVSLSNAYENRRARQVGEWERLYTSNVYRAV